MKGLVIGYGSIGSRHAKVMSDLGVEVGICSSRAIEGYAACFDRLSDALEQFNPDLVVVANKTSEHWTTLKFLERIRYTGKVLVEKPLAADLKGLESLALPNVFVGYNLRFHPIVERLKALMEQASACSAYVYAGQFLPGWRPARNYAEVYSAKVEEGGGVMRDLSHELDYLTWIFGFPSDSCAVLAQTTNLDISTEDHCMAWLATAKCPLVSVHLNYIDHIKQRRITVNTNERTIIADLVSGQLQINDHIEKHSTDMGETYRVQMRKLLAGDVSQHCTLEEAVHLTRLMANMELSSQEKKWVKT